MNENRVLPLRQKDEIDDPLTEILRSGARRLIAQAVEAEFETFLVSTVDLVLPDGRQRVVRHGHDPVRAIQTGIGPIEVQKPKARDPAVIARLKVEWEGEYRRWQARDLSARHYVYVWADGVYLQTRMEPQAECMLVLMGATPERRKELIGFQTGM